MLCVFQETVTKSERIFSRKRIVRYSQERLVYGLPYSQTIRPLAGECGVIADCRFLGDSCMERTVVFGVEAESCSSMRHEEKLALVSKRRIG